VLKIKNKYLIIKSFDFGGVATLGS